MIPGLSITTFNIDRYTTLESFLREYKEIGINILELNGRVPQLVIDELYPFIERGEIKISSLHNFCPKQDIDEREIQLSSLDNTMRKIAVDLTIETIEAANRVGARAIVLHVGGMKELADLEGSLRELYRANRQDSTEYNLIRDKLIHERTEVAKRYTQSYEKSLYELSDFIIKKNYDIKLGLENRYYYYEIPFIDEYDELFSQYPELPIYLWYDFGHGDVLHNLSLIDKHELLRRHGKRLVGLHIHDCRGIGDHMVPGTGDIDFTHIKEYLNPSIIKVLEYGRRFDTKSIVQGIRFLENSGVFY